MTTLTTAQLRAAGPTCPGCGGQHLNDAETAVREIMAATGATREDAIKIAAAQRVAENPPDPYALALAKRNAR